MTLPRRWTNPKLTSEEIEEIDRRRSKLKKELSGLNIKPTRSGEVGFRPIKLGEPSPETPHERFKREKAERLAREAAAKKSGGEESDT